MDFNQTFIDTLLGGVEELIRFGDLDLIFKVTFVLCNVQNRVFMHYLLNKLMDFDQTCIGTLLGEGEELIRFWRP